MYDFIDLLMFGAVCFAFGYFVKAFMEFIQNDAPLYGQAFVKEYNACPMCINCPQNCPFDGFVTRLDNEDL